MIRIIIENLLLFLTPAFMYFAFVLITRGASQGQAGNDNPSPVADIFDGAPYIWLFFAGTALVLLILVAFGTTSGGRPGQNYTPPVMKDGRIQPGHIE